MGGKLSRSWAMTKESWAVLRADKTLVLFPLISSIALFFVLATFAVPVVLALMDAGVFDGRVKSEQELPLATRIVFLVVAFGYYFVSFTVMNFFNVALIGAAMERFDGRDAGVRVGLSIAVKRIPQILLWSLVSATIGMVLKAIEERLGIIGRIVIAFVGMAWAIASFFVVPVLAVEGLGPFDALKRSVSVLKKSWGEAALTRIGVNVVSSVLLMLILGGGMVATIALFVVTESVGLTVAMAALVIVAAVILGLISTTLQSILQAAIYRYAAYETVAPGFSAATLRGAFEPKKSKKKT